jgi:putative phosphoserine phosphatase/1-acylglycerol-3-phosphate O-acyltransferase
VTQTVAFFDMDLTILTRSSGLLYVQYLWRNEDTKRRTVLRAYCYALLYKLGLFDYPSTAAKLAATVSDNSEAQSRVFCQRWFDDLAVHHISEKAVQAIDRHRGQGHVVTIISASTPYVVGPVAAHLGIEDHLCTRLEVRQGKFTGRIVEPPCYGPGKLVWAKRFADQHQASLSEAYFYSDSHSDRDLLTHVGHPVAANPDRHLCQLAKVNGWPIVRFY